MSRPVEKSESEWREQLGPERYAVLRESATERAFSGDLLKVKEPGAFVCAGCGTELFETATKFESGSGWPSFSQPAADGAVEELTDTSHGMVRVEVQCATCGGHLGHVFSDGPQPTGQRYCINSASLEFEPDSAQQ